MLEAGAEPSPTAAPDDCRLDQVLAFIRGRNPSALQSLDAHLERKKLVPSIPLGYKNLTSSYG